MVLNSHEVPCERSRVDSSRPGGQPKVCRLWLGSDQRRRARLSQDCSWLRSN